MEQRRKVSATIRDDTPVYIPVNPDGPDAAALLKEAEAALSSIILKVSARWYSPEQALIEIEDIANSTLSKLKEASNPAPNKEGNN